MRVSFLSALVAVLVVGCGSSGDHTATKPARAQAVSYVAPGTANPPKPAAPLPLRNYDGRPVNLNDYRGKAVFVTFIYTHCPDTCPLIVANLRNAQLQLGTRASEMQIIAVSTDPAQDTPAAVRHFLRAHLMTGRMKYLLGSARQLKRAWSAWGIKAKRVDPKPADVEHSALIYGISGSGKVTTLYPSNFKPAWIVQDSPKLAAH